jgi:hypothetical protein
MARANSDGLNSPTRFSSLSLAVRKSARICSNSRLLWLASTVFRFFKSPLMGGICFDGWRTYAMNSVSEIEIDASLGPVRADPCPSRLWQFEQPTFRYSRFPLFWSPLVGLACGDCPEAAVSAKSDMRIVQ